MGHFQNGQIRAQIRSFVAQELETRGLTDIADDASLFETGILDSMRIFQLIGFLQSSFGIHISDQDILLSNFESIDAAVSFVARKQSTP